MSDALLDRVRVFHFYAGCPGVIRSVARIDAPAGMLALECTECGATLGGIEKGLLDELLSLIGPRKDEG